jgi:hypothetical protein
VQIKKTAKLEFAATLLRHQSTVSTHLDRTAKKI